MRHRILALLALGTILFATATCGSKSAPVIPDPPTDGADSDDGPFEVPFEKYTLENGLTVILHQDKSDPIVAMATIVHVGSAREKPGRTGFAHFFEHMSFNNSENVPMGANRKMIPELGGTRNGGTWDDGTIYYEVVPKDAFEKLMWIDSDRFGYMINTVKEATLEREKQVVKNEKRQRVDNRPYGHTEHVIRKALYPADHPYNWTVIGDLADLQAATLNDVREFYDRFYVPANATLVVAGDIDFDRTRKLIATWFGEIKPGEASADLPPAPVTLTASKKLYHLDTFAKVAELQMTFPTVHESHADRWALEALGDILADGKSAPLFKTIVVDAKQSSSVAAYQDSSELAGVFKLHVRANPGVDLDDITRSIETAMASFEKNGFRDTDLQRIKAKSETSFYSGIESILDRALQLGINEEFYGDASFLLEHPKRVAAVTREDVVRVYNKYIKGKPAIITSFVPKDAPALVVEGSQKADVVEEAIVAGAEKEFNETDADDFKRTPTKHDRKEPPLGPRPTLRAPKVWRAKTTQRGIAVVGIEQRELPMVAFNLRIDGGQFLDGTKTGGARLTAEMLNEGTAKRTPEELQDAIDLLGASLSVSASRSAINIGGRVLAKNFPQLMELATEMILEPRWDAVEFERLKTARLAAIEQRDGNPVAVARLAFGRQIYGASHPAGEPFGGSTETVGALTLDDLKSWYAGAFTPDRATLHVAGDVGSAEVVATMARLDREWDAEPAMVAGFGVKGSKINARPFFIDIPDAKQSVIMVGKIGPAGDYPRFYPLSVAVNRLGSGSSARLTQKLRIEKGYSYGAWAGFTRATYPGTFVATSQVRSNVTLESLQIFKDLIGNYKETFTADDLETTINLVSKGDTRSFETLWQLVGVLETMTLYKLPDDYIERQSKELAALTLADVHALLDEHLDESSMVYLIVGDARTQLENVAKLGRGKPILLDRQGALIEPGK